MTRRKRLTSRTAKRKKQVKRKQKYSERRNKSSFSGSGALSGRPFFAPFDQSKRTAAYHGSPFEYIYKDKAVTAHPKAEPAGGNIGSPRTFLPPMTFTAKACAAPQTKAQPPTGRKGRLSFAFSSGKLGLYELSWASRVILHGASDRRHERKYAVILCAVLPIGGHFILCLFFFVDSGGKNVI